MFKSSLYTACVGQADTAKQLNIRCVNRENKCVCQVYVESDKYC